jgi:hypothetical protein
MFPLKVPRVAGKGSYDLRSLKSRTIVQIMSAIDGCQYATAAMMTRR